MKKVDAQNAMFNLLCGLFACACLILSYYALHLSVSIAIFCLIMGLFACVSLAGSVMSIRYLEGCVVRYLLHLGGSAHREQLEKRYSRRGCMEFVVNSLSSRGVVSVHDEVVNLNQAALKRGLRNALMMWATRRLYKSTALGSE